MKTPIRFFIFEFDDIPKNKFFRFIFLLTGRIRLFWGLCPLCNSDAPLVYSCKVCFGFHFRSRYASPNKILKLKWLNSFKSILRG